MIKGRESLRSETIYVQCMVLYPRWFGRDGLSLIELEVRIKAFISDGLKLSIDRSNLSRFSLQLCYFFRWHRYCDRRRDTLLSSAQSCDVIGMAVVDGWLCYCIGYFFRLVRSISVFAVTVFHRSFGQGHAFPPFSVVK